jgi:hypothetical protein
MRTGSVMLCIINHPWNALGFNPGFCNVKLKPSRLGYSVVNIEKEVKI